VPKKVKQIIVHFFLDTYSANKTKIDLSVMRMNDSEMSNR